MHALILSLLITLSGIVVGCASGTFEHPSLVSGEVPSAELVLVRERGLAFVFDALTVRLDGEKLAKLRTGRYVAFRLAPGTYQLTLDEPQNPFTVTIAQLDDVELEPGTRSYILLGKVGTSWGGGVSASSTGQSSVSIGPAPVMGFQLIHEEVAQDLIREYQVVGAGSD
jgi:hypothetical protein